MTAQQTLLSACNMVGNSLLGKMQQQLVRTKPPEDQPPTLETITDPAERVVRALVSTVDEFMRAQQVNPLAAGRQFIFKGDIVDAAELGKAVHLRLGPWRIGVRSDGGRAFLQMECELGVEVQADRPTDRLLIASR